LETTLLAARELKDNFSFNPDAPCFAPFSGDPHRLGNALYDNFGFGIKPSGNDVVSEPAHISTDPVVASDLLIGTWDPRHIEIDVDSFEHSLTNPPTSHVSAC
jgi:hypothetical protein